MPPAQSVPVTLLSFTISSVVASFLYAGDRRIDFRRATLLTAASVPGIGLGLFIGAHLSPQTWNRAIGAMLILAAVWLLGPRYEATHKNPAGATWWVGGAGFIAGIAAVVAGVTGPLIMLPGLRLAGVSSTSAVATSLLASVCVSFAAVAGYAARGGLLHPMAVSIAPVVLVGTVTGVMLSRRVTAPMLGGLVRALCGAAGLWMLLR
jgi:uncharacterized membrane protein YfcA